jgi:hypothetical protein
MRPAFPQGAPARVTFHLPIDCPGEQKPAADPPAARAFDEAGANPVRKSA